MVFLQRTLKVIFKPSLSSDHNSPDHSPPALHNSWHCPRVSTLGWCHPPPSRHLDPLPVPHKYHILGKLIIITIPSGEREQIDSKTLSQYIKVQHFYENRRYNFFFISSIKCSAPTQSLNTRVHTCSCGDQVLVCVTVTLSRSISVTQPGCHED